MICHRRSSCHEHSWSFSRWSRRSFPAVRYLILLAALLGTLGLLGIMEGNGGSTTVYAAEVAYIYDEVGRLRAVVDPAGETALYAYDAVGNLLNITRESSGQVAIIQFLPDHGPEGTSVTISGIGFSPTPSLNTVSFNGTTATVVSATTTEIVASVPVGAATGTLMVTSPNGSDTSSQPFTVTAFSGVPTITSVNPSLAIPATAVTIDGTNFDTTSGNTKVYFNVTKDTQAIISANSISTAIPTTATSALSKSVRCKGWPLARTCLSHPRPIRSIRWKVRVASLRAEDPPVCPLPTKITSP